VSSPIAPMNGVIEAATADEARGALPADPPDRPHPDWVRGHCPQCGGELVSNIYYVGGKGYLRRLECWESLGTAPTCAYHRVG